MSINSQEQPAAAPMTPPERPSIVCGAKTRAGVPCLNPPEEGRRRCRLHGGAQGSGAPMGNKNAQKHGFYSAEAIARRRDARRLVKESRELMHRLFEISG